MDFFKPPAYQPLSRHIGRLIPASARSHLRTALRAENLVVAFLLAVSVIPGYGLFFRWLGDGPSALACFAAMPFVGATLLILRRYGAVRAARTVLATTIYLLVLFIIYRTGGAGSPFLIWLAACPLLATAAGGALHGLGWTCMVLATATGVYAAGGHWTLPQPQVRDMLLLRFAATTSFVMVIAVFLLVYERINASAIKRLDQAFGVIHALAIRDDLTGVLNRRELFRIAERECHRAARHGTPLSFCLLDVDNFKVINDTWGHATGDEVLKRVAGTIAGTVRKSDAFGRYGGEEFLLLLVGMDLANAGSFVERVRKALEAMPIDELGGRGITVSAGIAQYRTNESVAQALGRADRALYCAKGDGRNRIALEAA
ncbi:GGDEF domain-containing protein [Oxalobacteraceae bacterium OM1]|nr:GGDEF domain-containing protein [Oxalobacteraceae bacterium OM1]